MRLVNRSYTQIKFKISEGLGGGRDTWYHSREGDLLLSISMAGGKSKVARLQGDTGKEIEETQAPKSEFWPGLGPSTGILRGGGTGAQSIE